MDGIFSASKMLGMPGHKMSKYDFSPEVAIAAVYKRLSFILSYSVHMNCLTALSFNARILYYGA